MSSITLPSQKPFLTRRLALGLSPAQLLLAAITLLSLALHLTNLTAIGDANVYYTAAVKSMLQSWHNFFFIAAEPGGSVTVDKPPLGLWVEAAFAFVLGVSGISTSLPNILAGALSVPLLYALLRKHWGTLAGLVAALALALTPVVLATDRNNTMDGMLVFTLLLAAWAFLRAADTAKTRWLLLGALLVGLGFNIKMLQAFLPLPTFYALYLLGAPKGWLRKIFDLALASLLLAAVSLSWALIVDLTPPDQRPYVGSSQDNRVMELIIGHNALSRITNPRAGRPAAPQNPTPLPPSSPPRPPLASDSQPSGIQPPPGRPPGGSGPPAGALGDGPYASPAGGLAPGGTPFSQETGAPGLGRFFRPPLSKQMSWLLPFALLSLIPLAFAARPHLPLAAEHKALLLWGGWLLTCLIFFSFMQGIFHAYYTIMLAPPLAALVGGGFAQLWRRGSQSRPADAFLLLAAGLTLLFQIYSAFQYGVRSPLTLLPLIPLLIGAGLLWVRAARPAAYAALLASLIFIPFLWTTWTVLEDTPNVNLPTAFQATQAQGRPRRLGPLPQGQNPIQEALLEYLLTNSQDVQYLVAVPNARLGAPLVLASGRPVLYMGGFSGNDPVVDAADLAEMVAEGRLRFVLLSGPGGVRQKQEVAAWVRGSCRPVPLFSRPPGPPRPGLHGQRPPAQAPMLFRCG